MARVANTPCADCGRLLYVGKGSLANPICQPCRRINPRRKRPPKATPRTVDCRGCGTTFSTVQPKAEWCSRRCRLSTVQNCVVCGKQFTGYRGTSAQPPARHCSRACVMKARPPAPTKAGAMPVPWRRCRRCDQWFVGARNRRYCGVECRRLHNIDKALGAYRLATSRGDIRGGAGWFRRIVTYLAHRDGERCVICSKVIDLALPSGPRGDPMGPSIDHLVPRSQGGADELSNVRLTHWACNRARGNRGGNEQLMLLG